MDSRITAVADVEEIDEEAGSVEHVLEGTEVVLGPALDSAVFPFGIPEGSPIDRLRALLASDADEQTLCELRDVLFPAGMPARVDAKDVLRALRDAAARERAALREDRVFQDERAIALRVARLARLWAMATERHSAAARSVDARAALLMQAIAARWARIARCTDTDVAA